MGRKRTTASQKRILQLSNDKNSEFLLNAIPEKKKAPNCKNSRPRLEGTNDDLVGLNAQPQPDSSKPRENGTEQNGDSQNLHAGRPKSSARLTPASKTPDYAATETLPEKSSNPVDLHGEPNAGSSNPPESENIAKPRENNTDFEENSDVSDTSANFHGFNDDSVGETEKTMRKFITTQRVINSECSCGSAKKLSKLKVENEKLRKHNSFLMKRRTDLERSHARLQEALVSKLLPSARKPFENLEGIPEGLSAARISNMSMVAKDSDYIFIKLLMTAIWPEGFAGRTVTGRTSNNPKGRGKKNPEPIENPEDADDNANPVRTALEQDKVKFVNECLEERRILLHDDILVARRVASKCNRLMQFVIGNSNRYH